ncbi:MAG: MarR family winged helix-turn-helix transcriptional regulator, partial [Phyllobacterium sp.]
TMMVPNYLQNMGGIDATSKDSAESPNGRKPGNMTTPIMTHFELARTLERVNRRFSAFLQSEMTRLGVEEIGPAHLMLLLAIGNDEISVSQLMERGPYAGTNLSYYLKQLGECGYIERNALQRDRRAARIKLSEKGQQLCADMTEIAASCHKLVANDAENIRNLEIAFRTLDRIEQTWASAAIFGARGEK